MRAVLVVFAINISAFFLGLLQVGPSILILILVLMFVTGFYTFQLDTAMKAPPVSAWIGALLAAVFSVTCIGLVIMAMVSSRAGKLLKTRGLKGGFMGVSQQNLDTWQIANPAE